VFPARVKIYQGIKWQDKIYRLVVPDYKSCVACVLESGNFCGRMKRNGFAAGFIFAYRRENVFARGLLSSV